MSQPPGIRPRAGLFVTCLVDLIRPSVGFAAARLIEASGCEVVVPTSQTCCGQPAYNSGDRATARRLAIQTIAAFAECDYVVAPSGSCAAMLKRHYPSLFADSDDATLQARAASFAESVHELTSFLVDVRGLRALPPEIAANFSGTVTYHDSCSGLRELGIKSQPRQLLTSVKGVELTEMSDCETCCGFGGAFSVKYPDISNAMVERKASAIEQSGATLVLAGDLGCLLNMAGKMSRQGTPIAARHVAEVLAGELTDAPLGIEPRE